MEIKFDKKYLQELYEIGATTDKKHRIALSSKQHK
jgi:hypothetical protein